MAQNAGDRPDDPPQGTDSAAASRRLRIRPDEPAPTAGKRLSIRPAARGGQPPATADRITLTRRPTVVDPDPGPPTPVPQVTVRREEPVAPTAATVDWRPIVRKPRPWFLRPPALAAYGFVLLLVLGIPGFLYYQEQEAQARHREAMLALGKGNEAMAQQRPRQAIADYSRAIRLDAASLDSYRSRGTAYWLIGELAPAESDFRRIVELRPAEPLPLARLLGVLAEAGRKDEAERVGRKTFEQDKSRDWALALWLEAVLSARGAERLLAEIATLEGGGLRNAVTAFHKGTAYLELKRYAEAIPSFKEALQGDRARIPPEAWSSLATAYKGVGDRPQCAQAVAEHNKRTGRSDDETRFCEQ